MPEETKGPMTLAQAKRAWANVQPFTIEFGDVNCRNHSISTLRVKVRGRWSVSEMMQRPEGARDLGEAMAKMPATPGQTLTVYPEKMECLVHDPLQDDPNTLQRIETALQQARRVSGPVTFVPDLRQTLNPDSLKTLCYEVLRKLEAKNATVIDGKAPTEIELTKLPGRELFDSWNNNARRPKYKDEVSDWEASIDKVIT